MDFQISVEDKGEVYRGIRIQIPRALYDDRMKNAVMKASRQVKMKGFRPGRVPPDMVAKMYGQELKAEVMDELVQQALDRAYEDHKLSVVGVSSVEMEPEQGDGDLAVKAEVAIFPEPEIKKFRGLSVEIEKPEVNEDVVEKYLASFLESRAKFEPREENEAVSAGDGVVVDRVAVIEGASDSPLKKDNELMILAGKRAGDLPEEIRKALLGKKIGDEITVTVKHPEDYKQIPELAGKTATYTITVKSVYSINIPTLNPQLMEEVAKVDNEEEFRKKLREDLNTEAERRYEVGKEEKLFEKLISENTFEVPQELIDHEIRNLLFEMGVLKREDRRAYQVDISRFRERLGQRAEFRVRSGIILGRVREQEGISVDDTDREEWITKTCERDKIDDREGFSKAVRAGDRERWFEDVVLREKVVKMLLESSTVTEKSTMLDV